MNQWVVWVNDGDGWKQQFTGAEHEAMSVYYELHADDFRVRIHPRHRNSISDIREG